MPVAAFSNAEAQSHTRGEHLLVDMRYFTNKRAELCLTGGPAH